MAQNQYTNLCGECGTRHFGPCTKGIVEARHSRERQAKIADMRTRLCRAAVLKDVRELADIVGDVIDMIEKE